MLETFDKKVIDLIKNGNFEKDIFNNEIVWTYAIAKMAEEKPNIYKLITTFDKLEKDNIFLESQPLVPYLGDEGNSHLDIALGAVKIRGTTTSGIEFAGVGNVCFVEAKYLSDIDTKTSFSPIRSQMDRVIENLLNFDKDGVFSEKVVFTLLTPRIFKKIHGKRFYYYKFNEYEQDILLGRHEELYAKIKLESINLRNRDGNYESKIKDRFKNLSINWVTFEDIIESQFEELNRLDITKFDDAEKAWVRLKTYLHKLDNEKA